MDADAMWVRPNYVHVLSTHGWLCDYTGWIAIGSGACYARAILESELWPQDSGELLGSVAMRTAMKLDPETGGELEIHEVRT